MKKQTIVFFVLFSLVTPAHAVEKLSSDHCVRMVQVRDMIQPVRNLGSQAAQVREGFQTLEKAATALNETASPECVDALTTLAHRMIKASPAFEGIESFGIFWGKNAKTKKAAEDAINRLPEKERAEMNERLKALKSREIDDARLESSAVNVVTATKGRLR